MASEIVLKAWFEKIDRDLTFLINSFKDVLEEQGEADLARCLPWITEEGVTPSSNRREGEPLERELQVLSIAFQLLNLVEENAAAQARRSREQERGLLIEPGLWGQQLRELIDAGLSEDEIAAALPEMHVEVVLTAHPTEAKRPIVLKQHRALFEALEELENPVWTDREREAITRRIKVILERLWRTGEMHLQKPDVESELAHVLDFFRMVFPNVLSSLDQRFRDSWVKAGFDLNKVRSADNLPRLSFGNWVGGDRDGHPFVTADVTRKTLERLRQTAMEGVDQHLDTIFDNLSLSDLLQEPPESLLQAIRERVETLGVTGKNIVDENHREPWRQFVGLVRASVHADSESPSCAYVHPEELEADLDILRESLEKVGAVRLIESEIEPLSRYLDVFGFHTAALDIRQNSDFHEKALIELFEAAGIPQEGYSDWPEERRRDFLTAELESARPLAPVGAKLGEKASAMVSCYKVVARHIERYGREGIGAFVVSMTRDMSDLLTVYLLAREAGLLRATAEGLACEIDVVPLFETVEDLQRCSSIMDDFLAHPVTQRSLSLQDREKPVQQIMVGYSDSNKGSGLFASHWNLHRAQKHLTDVANKHGVLFEFFHGRGGTFSRGAGPTHRFLDSLPHGSVTGHFRLTEQGETIAQKYGNRPTAVYNLELLLAGVTATTLKHRLPFERDQRLVELGDRLNELSRQAYEDLLDSEGFLEFWSEATPIDALEHSFIGSRPARRTGKRTMEDLRAIPWVFSWIQSRFYLPGWYGLGSAFSRLQEEDAESFELLLERAPKWPFMRYVLYNAETSLKSADLELMRDYSNLVKNEEIRDRYYNRIAEEHRKTEDMINQIFGAPRDARRPRMEKTILMRDDGLRFLHRRQIALLREWRKRREAGNDEEAEAMLPSLLFSINAIASGQRTTG